MIDYGLLVSVVIAFGVPTMLERRWGAVDFGEPVGFVDVAVGPALAGLVVGRLVTLALDDPNSIGSLADMVIVRSGVEFWPGVAAATVVLAWAARRNGRPPVRSIGAIAPLAIVGYAGYEAACLFRDGCFGPAAPVGLRPPGLSTTMLPIGLFMAAVLVAGAIVIRSMSHRGWPVVVVVSTAALIVAVVRAIGSIWLPRIGDGLTRQHVTSIGVILAASVAVIAGAAFSRRQEAVRAPTAT